MDTPGPGVTDTGPTTGVRVDDGTGRPALCGSSPSHIIPVSHNPR